MRSSNNTKHETSSMKKIIRYYDMAVARLCGIGADKYVHVLCCLLICALVGAFAGIWLDDAEASLVGFGAAMFAGASKEVWDGIRGEALDLKDLAADTFRAAVGAVLVMIL